MYSIFYVNMYFNLVISSVVCTISSCKHMMIIGFYFYIYVVFNFMLFNLEFAVIGSEMKF